MAFQSTPVITDGRTILREIEEQAPWRFNPRPSSLTGELVNVVGPNGIGVVSIHARHH